MHTRYALAAAVALVISAGSARADDLDALASKFGARQSFRGASISPDGDKIVFIGARPNGGENAVVVDLKTKNMVPIFSSKGRDEMLTHCQFILEARVVCGVQLYAKNGSQVVYASRLASIAADGSEMKALSAPASNSAYYQSDFGGGIIDYNVPGDPNAVLMIEVMAAQVQSSSLLARSADGVGVNKVNVFTTKRNDIVRPRRTAIEYISDGQGNVRIMGTAPVNESGYAQGQINYSFRAIDGVDWQPLSTVEDPTGVGLSKGFDPYAVDPVNDVAYGFEAINGATALVQRKLAVGATSQVLLSRPGSDVDELIQIGRRQRVVGVSYTTEKRVVEYFDPELKKLSANLQKALPGNPMISLIDADADEGKLLVLASRDTDPGTLYLYDKVTRQLGQVLPVRDELVGAKLAESRPVTFPARDGTMIPGYLTLPPGSDGKNLPALVMPHGGPAARDEWGFDWLSQFFAARGFAVLQPNYRGSTGYGSDWFKSNGFQSWEQAMSDIIDAGKWLEKQGTTTPDKLAIFGWSYGGYAALQTAVLDPTVFKAIVAVAPVTDLDITKNQDRDSLFYRSTERFIGTGPHIAAGSPARHADRMTAPVLLFHGDIDRNVAVTQSRLMADRLRGAGKQVEYVEFAGLDHQLDDAAARKKMLMTSDQFLRRTLHLP